MTYSGRFQATLSGAAVVCCPHDRAKREVVTERQVVELGWSVGQIYDPKQHRIWMCACCQNLFVGTTDTPKYCHTCERGPLQHPLGGALAAPNERPA